MEEPVKNFISDLLRTFNPRANLRNSKRIATKYKTTSTKQGLSPYNFESREQNDTLGRRGRGKQEALTEPGKEKAAL